MPRLRIVGILVLCGLVACAGAMLAVLFIASSARGRELYPGQYAQVDPKVQQWFKDQTIPGTNQRCCDISDGEYAEEDIRDGHYWTRSPKSQGKWLQVPDAAVIHDPNRNGEPVVWYSYDSDADDGGYAALTIRCYAPGGKA